MYLNQTARWSKVVTTAVDNKFGEFQYDNAEQTIKVRRQPHVEEVRTKDGQIHKTNFIYYTHEDVREDDRLDGFLVVKVYGMMTLGGREKLRRVITV